MKKWILAALMAMFATSAIAEEKVVTLSTTNLLTLRDQVSDESVTPIILDLMILPGEEVTLFINSPGGSILAGQTLINAIKGSGKKVTCIADFAASMAFSILQACHVRYVAYGAIIMQHQASFGTSGSVSEVRKQLELVEKLADGLNKADAAQLGLPVEKFKKLIREEWWLYDSEIVANNAADAQVLVRCTPALAKKEEKQVIKSLFGSATLTWSGCPLAIYPISVEMKRHRDASVKDYNEWVTGLELDRDWKTRREVKD